MDQQNLFADDWIACLRAHYAHVIREHDDNNEGSLVSVLLETGFTEDDIAEMRTEVAATFEPEEVPVEPQLMIVEDTAYEWVLPPEPVIAVNVEDTAYEWVLPEEPLPTAEIPVELVDEVLPIEEVEEVEPAASNDEEPPESFVQMSMF